MILSIPSILTATVAFYASSAYATVYMAGDSTMARGNGVIEGWGQFLGEYLTVPVVNKAIGGRSARSYTREGRFQEIIDLVKTGDYVVIAFGFNDGGSPNTNDNGRSDCPGQGAEVCNVVYDGKAEAVHTFPWYLEQAAGSLKAKGATVIIASKLPRNNWNADGKTVSADDRFIALAQKAATTAKVQYIDHHAFSRKEYEALGKAKVDSMYPQDPVHPGPALAKINAQAFVKGVIAGKAALADKLNAAGKALGGSAAVTTIKTVTTAKSTTTTTKTTASSGSCTNQKYAQCGGQGWTGPTCCNGSTCQFSNQWYSQCL